MDHFDILTLVTRLIKKSMRSSLISGTFDNVMSMNSKSGQLIYRDVFPPVDLSDAGKADRDAMRQRGEFLMFMDAEQCPRLEFLTGAAGNVALRLDETLAPTREPTKPAAPQVAPRTPRAPR